MKNQRGKKPDSISKSQREKRWNFLLNSLGAIAVVIPLVWAIIGIYQYEKEEVDEIMLGDVKLSTLAGDPIDMNEFKGKTVFINFWATWCKPCIQEMPTIASVQEKLKGKDIIFLLASNEESDRIENFMKRHAYNFRYVQLKNMEALKIQALPTTFIFNQKGKLKFSENGFRIWNDPTNIELITTIMNNYEK